MSLRGRNAPSLGKEPLPLKKKKPVVIVFGPESQLRASNECPVSAPQRSGSDIVIGPYAFGVFAGVAQEYVKGNTRYYVRVLSGDYAVELERVDEEIMVVERTLQRLHAVRQQLLRDSLDTARVVVETDVP